MKDDVKNFKLGDLVRIIESTDDRDVTGQELGVIVGVARHNPNAMFLFYRFDKFWILRRFLAHVG